MPKRYHVVLNGYPAPYSEARTKWGAERIAKFARKHGFDAHAERVNTCGCCGLTGCPGGQECPDAQETP